MQTRMFTRLQSHFLRIFSTINTYYMSIIIRLKTIKQNTLSYEYSLKIIQAIALRGSIGLILQQ